MILNEAPLSKSENQNSLPKNKVILSERSVTLKFDRIMLLLQMTDRGFPFELDVRSFGNPS